MRDGLGGRRRLGPIAALLAVVAILVAAPAGAIGKGGAVVKGGSATFAMLPGSVPNYIFPMWSPVYASTANAFDFFLYKPLYWPGIGQNPVMNPRLSLGARTDVVEEQQDGYRQAQEAPLVKRAAAQREKREALAEHGDR